MQLGTKGRYAVSALLSMADNPRAVTSLTYISEKERITIPYLEQIFSKLRRAGIVKSHRGQAGGYSFVKDIKDISVAHVVIAVEENLYFTRCSRGAETFCHGSENVCKTHHLWEELTNRTLSFLENVTLEDVLNNKLNATNTIKNFEKKQA